MATVEVVNLLVAASPECTIVRVVFVVVFVVVDALVDVVTEGLDVGDMVVVAFVAGPVDLADVVAGDVGPATARPLGQTAWMPVPNSTTPTTAAPATNRRPRMVRTTRSVGCPALRTLPP
jgi:hypothetical protein